MKTTKTNTFQVTQLQISKLLEAAVVLGQIKATGKKDDRAAKATEVLNAMRNTPALAAWTPTLLDALNANALDVLAKCTHFNHQPQHDANGKLISEFL